MASGRRGVVAVDAQEVGQVRQDHVEVAVAVQVAKGQAAADLHLGREAPARLEDLAERAGAVVLVELVVLRVLAPPAVRRVRQARPPPDGSVRDQVLMTSAKQVRRPDDGNFSQGQIS